MPHDLPNGKTVYHYFRKWKLDGTWEKAMTALRKQVRTQMERWARTQRGHYLDSQSIKTSPVRGQERGFDALIVWIKDLLAGRRKSFPSRAMSRTSNGCSLMASPSCASCPKVAFRSNVIDGRWNAPLAG
jgi:transposase